MIFTELSVRPWQIIAGLLIPIAAAVMPDSDADTHRHIDETRALLYRAITPLLALRALQYCVIVTIVAAHLEGAQGKG
jgi:hypothetical protein